MVNHDTSKVCPSAFTEPSEINSNQSKHGGMESLINNRFIIKNHWTLQRSLKFPGPYSFKGLDMVVKQRVGLLQRSVLQS